MTVLSPADCTEAIKMMTAMSNIDGPAYMRLCGTTAIPTVYTEDYELQIGKAVKLQSGERAAMIATGITMVAEAQKAAFMLESEYGIRPTLINMHTIKPIDESCIREIAKTHEVIVSIEEHNILGGLGSAIAEVIMPLGEECRQLFIGINDQNCKMGSRAFMLKQVGLTCEDICKKIVDYIGVSSND